MMQSIRKRRTAVALATMCVAMGAQAMEFDTGNEDLTVRWDNTVRYNLGVRTERVDPNAYWDPRYDESTSKFERGDVVTNRLDLLSEFDVVYQRKMGARVSAAAWYDQAYHDSAVNGNPVFTGLGMGSYPGNQYTDYVKRWNKGLSGEFLDAFVFANGEVGDVPWGVKLGIHNVYWGESLFSFVHGVSYSQGPVDIRKAYTNPGVEAKELFLPLNQISGQVQLAPNFSLAGQYQFDWKPSRLPDGGTYLGLQDFVTQGGGTSVLGVLPFAGQLNHPDKSGDWGVKASWRPEVLDGTVGFYYREFTDKLGQFVVDPTQGVGLSYLEKEKLYGVSLSKEVGGVSIGSEVVYRKNSGLLMNAATTLGNEPRGNTWHALVNALYILPHNNLWDSGVLSTELTYSRLDKVTANAGNYNGLTDGGVCLQAVTNAPTTDKLDGCATKSAWGFAIKVEPTWYQVMDGVDLSLPVVYQVGLKGNSPVVFGGYEGNGSYSIGLVADIHSQYKVSLAYNDYLGKSKLLNLGPAGTFLNPNGIGYINDRGWLSLTVKTSF